MLKNKRMLNIYSVCIGMVSLLTISINTSAETVTDLVKKNWNMK
ncbi:hypothetical protein [Bacillus mycoides]